MGNKLPLKLRIFAKIAGLDMKFLAGIWSWLDGKKTYFGLFLGLLATVSDYWPQVSSAFPNAHWVLVGAGVIQFLNGWAHKAYKYKYNEEYVKNIKG